jgi:5-methyltetrahydrofolate--homocysteine methyltransferase
MSRINLRERIKQGLLLLDGAMGTQLIASGIEVGKCNEYLNIESPDIISNIHKAYLQTGSVAILTNTFGANRFALARHGFAEKVEKINTAGVKIARKAAGKGRYVLGDIGPSGDFLKPLGNLEPKDLKDAFTRQAKALAAGGVDGFIIETMTALDEAAIAIEAVKSASGDLPVFASFAFDRAGGDYRTMMGVDVKSAASKAVSLKVDAVGFNCGTTTLDEYIELAKKFISEITALEKTRATSHERRATILAEPNAGKPELVDGKAVYKVSPEDFASAVEKIHSLGVNIIGGCCGTGPEHIAAVNKKLQGGKG